MGPSHRINTDFSSSSLPSLSLLPLLIYPPSLSTSLSSSSPSLSMYPLLLPSLLFSLSLSLSLPFPFHFSLSLCPPLFHFSPSIPIFSCLLPLSFSPPFLLSLSPSLPLPPPAL